MGAPETENGSSDNERPQHNVTLTPFYMGKYPVTQAQWRAVVESTRRIKQDLYLQPSSFQGRWRPIGAILWNEAIEFCQRLSALTGRNYNLPSEAQWEYACRAGTTTPFHCGATITENLANYNTTKTYALEPQGTSRSHTNSDVDDFLPNAFGLYDMHGNVWEMCADSWHDNYDSAPTDGTVWQQNSNARYYVLRGGSWSNPPHDLRSASRGMFQGFKSDDWGFRLVCSFTDI